MQAEALAPEQQLTHGSVQLMHLAKKLGEKTKSAFQSTASSGMLLHTQQKMGLRCGELERRSQAWGCVGEGLAGAARSCRDDVPAPRSPRATGTGRGKSRRRDTNLKFVGAKFKLAEQNFLLCSCGWISVLPSGSLLPHHTCETQRPCRTTTAAEQRLCSGYAGASVRHGALGQPAVSL